MKKFDRIYQFKITLKGIKPDIWRRIQVPESYSFWDLHVAVQDAMGWQDYHLHDFTVRNPRTRKKERIGIPDEDFDLEFLPGWELNIADYFSLKNSTATYVYDYGDDWVHFVKLEKILPRVKSKKYPRCVGGERACPPEDCGGIHGYEEFLQAIMDPGHEQHENLLTWAGGNFEPEVFDPYKVRFDDPGKRWKHAFG
jgi:pRiA4b ORF-3-like protein